MDQSEHRPVFVFIDGIFGGGVSNTVRDHLRKKYPAYLFLDLSCGPVSSVADRATECFYELYGGRVDYSCGLDGEPLEKGHDRYGRLEAGLLGSSNWSETAPIHIFAYSLGAPTARYLQYLLSKQVNPPLLFLSILIGFSFSPLLGCRPTQTGCPQAFLDEMGRPIRTSASWIASICTCQVNSPQRGVQTHSPPLSSDEWSCADVERMVVFAGSQQRDGRRVRSGAISEDAGARGHVAHVVVWQPLSPPLVCPACVVRACGACPGVPHRARIQRKAPRPAPVRRVTPRARCARAMPRCKAQCDGA